MLVKVPLYPLWGSHQWISFLSTCLQTNTGNQPDMLSAQKKAEIGKGQLRTQINPAVSLLISTTYLRRFTKMAAEWSINQPTTNGAFVWIFVYHLVKWRAGINVCISVLVVSDSSALELLSSSTTSLGFFSSLTWCLQIILWSLLVQWKSLWLMRLSCDLHAACGFSPFCVFCLVGFCCCLVFFRCVGGFCLFVGLILFWFFFLERGLFAPFAKPEGKLGHPGLQSGPQMSLDSKMAAIAVPICHIIGQNSCTSFSWDKNMQGH